MIDDFDDKIDDLIGGAPRKLVDRAPATFKPVEERMFSEACEACGGSGKFVSNRTGRVVGQCFKCKGTGQKTFKTAPETRAKARAKSAERKREVREAFAEEHKAEIAWVRDNARRQEDNMGFPGRKVWDFPIKMAEAFAEWGSFTDGQLAAIRKCMIRDEERAKERAATKAHPGTAVDASKIEQAFAHARERAKRPGQLGTWTKPLTLRDEERKLDITFRPGSIGSQWEGMIFAREGERKLGFIKSGMFKRQFACTDADEAAIKVVAEDPHKAAIAHAQAFGRCGICGQTLTADESIARGIGPICAEKFGWA